MLFDYRRYHWLVGQSVAHAGLSRVEVIYQALARAFRFLADPSKLTCQPQRIVDEGIRFRISSARK
jgi:hypothetical protein